MAAILLQATIRLLLGGQILMLASFRTWFLVVNMISLAAAVLLLKYYHYQKYSLALYTGAIATASNLCYFIVVYTIMTAKVLGNYNLPLLFFSLSANIVYALSIVFSSTGKNRWLKLAGILMFLIGLVAVSAVIWSKTTRVGQFNSTFETITGWISMTSSLVPGLFIVHFASGSRPSKKESETTPMQRSWQKMVGLIGILAFVFMLVFGIELSSESYSSLYWGRQNFENTKALARLFEARFYKSHKGDTLFYRLLKPLNYDPKKKYPLVVSLPYGGQPATDKIRQIEGAAAAELLSSEINREKYPAFLFIPDCPPGSGWGGIPNYPSVDSLVYEAIHSLDDSPGIDVKRRYVTGISRGGYGTWHFICTRPDMFAAAIPVCGGGDPALASKIVHVAVWAFHGRKDENVPVSGSRDMISAIKKAGGDPKYTELPNEGHNIWYEVSMTPGLMEWLFAQHRN
jgi:hypothetical protein